MKRFRPTLTAFVLSGAFGVIVLIGVLFFVFFGASRRAIAKSSEQLREAAARSVETRVRTQLGVARQVLENVERRIQLGLLAPTDAGALERAFFGEISDTPRLEEITLTRANLHLTPAGEPVVDEGRWQVSVSRVDASKASAVRTRRVTPSDDPKDGGYVAVTQDRAPDARYDDPRPQSRAPAKDPTDNDTFASTILPDYYGEIIWSDIHFTQNDEDLPPEKRRVVVSAIKAIEDSEHKFVGVLRVGILAEMLDEVGRSRVDEADPDDPHRIFICDERGRLVTRLDPSDPVVIMGDDLRVAPRNTPPAIEMALRSPVLAAWNASSLEDALATSSRSFPLVRFDVGGRAYAATFLHYAQDPNEEVGWNIGVVVPEDWYARDLRRLEKVFLIAYAAIAVLIVVGGALLLRALRRGLGTIVQSTTQIRQLDFHATESKIAFRDVQEVMDSLERAKTAMRALGKYVPVDLVRQLFQANKDPVLGGELQTISMMFTDIEGFTSLSEVLAPNDLARALGQYLETMAGAIAKTGGTIDKFIGDAVMAIWNAPTPCEAHGKKACEAALACIEATSKLYASPAWGKKSALFTRFGLHKGEVLVGHFGAPARMSFTALGDGVNLAARLESLCKQYGVAIIASDTIEAEANDAFVFRALDLVAVKGKKKGVRVFELLGRVGEPLANVDAVKDYEQAFEAYLQRDFIRATELLAPHPGDRPSVILLARCQKLAASPPPAEWDGVYVASSK